MIIEKTRRIFRRYSTRHWTTPAITGLGVKFHAVYVQQIERTLIVILCSGGELIVVSKHFAALAKELLNTNKSISIIMIAPLIGCECHRFNLAVTRILTEEYCIIDKINGIITEFKNLTLPTKLLKLPRLRGKTKYVTPWYYVLKIKIRYQKV